MKDDGVRYVDYLEQLTYLIFVKMADEQGRLLGDKSLVPTNVAWPTLINESGPELEDQYDLTLEVLSNSSELPGVIFHRAKNYIRNPAKLERLVKQTVGQEDWLSLNADLKGQAYEMLLEQASNSSQLGKHFTPRALISAIVDVMLPGPMDRICDPACGTGGFFLGAYQSILNRYPSLDPDQRAHLLSGAFTGWEIADLPARLCAMNLLMHGVLMPDSKSPIRVDDALRDDPGQRFDIVLTNPEYGQSASGTYEREDFWATTRNKQLNFVQHVVSLLKVGGNAAVMVPDNVLFEGGAGETIRRRLLHDCDVHTLLRLPTGIFYAGGVKANILFFQRREGASTPWTRHLWVYDLRTNQHFTLRQNPLTRADLDDFVACYNPDNRHHRTETDRFKRYTYDELLARDEVNLNLTWLRDESLQDPEGLPQPHVIARATLVELQSALEELTALADMLEPTEDQPGHPAA